MPDLGWPGARSAVVAGDRLFGLAADGCALAGGGVGRRGGLVVARHGGVRRPAAAWCSSGSEEAQEDELGAGDDVDAAGSVREREGAAEADRTCSLVRRRLGPKDVEA